MKGGDITPSENILLQNGIGVMLLMKCLHHYERIEMFNAL